MLWIWLWKKGWLGDLGFILCPVYPKTKRRKRVQIDSLMSQYSKWLLSQNTQLQPHREKGNFLTSRAIRFLSDFPYPLAGHVYHSSRVSTHVWRPLSPAPGLLPFQTPEVAIPASQCSDQQGGHRRTPPTPMLCNSDTGHSVFHKAFPVAPPGRNCCPCLSNTLKASSNLVCLKKSTLPFPQLVLQNSLAPWMAMDKERNLWGEKKKGNLV